MEQPHTDLGEGVVGTRTSVCPAPSSQPPAKATIYKAVSACSHGMPGASSLARWQGEGREEGGGKEEGEEEAGTLMGSPAKSERPQQAPPGLNLHTVLPPPLCPHDSPWTRVL